MAFQNNKNIVSVMLQKGITHIGNSAFYGCLNLSSVSVPDTLVSVAGNAFNNCPSLKYNKDGLGGDNYYLGNKKNKYVLLLGGEPDDINHNTKVIADEAFSNYFRLYGINGFYLSATYVGKSAFAGSNISEIWGTGTKSIGDFAFSGCKYLYEFDVGNDLVTINKNAFDGCEMLQYTIYGNAKYLGNRDNPYYLLVGALDDSISVSNIHKDTKCIAGKAFAECKNLMSLNFDGSKDQWAKIHKNTSWFDLKNHTFSKIICSNGQVEIVE